MILTRGFKNVFFPVRRSPPYILLVTVFAKNRPSRPSVIPPALLRSPRMRFATRGSTCNTKPWRHYISAIRSPPRKFVCVCVCIRVVACITFFMLEKKNSKKIIRPLLTPLFSPTFHACVFYILFYYNVRGSEYIG